jgi:predicted GNAT family acetyltransferase
MSDRAADDAILRLAEASNAYEPIGDGEHLFVEQSYVLFLGRGDDPRFNSVQYLRLSPQTLDATVAEIRDRAREHGRHALIWEVAHSATPADLVERLQALGLTLATPPMAVVMALRTPPPPPPPEIVVSRVESIADFRAYVTITHEVFGMLDQLDAELERIEREGAGDLARQQFVRYLAWIEGEPIAAASALFTDAGVMLHSGSTRPIARGRGAYRALVAARWHDAVERGTPVVVTRAGPQSRPILRQVGFAELTEIHFLIDRFD